MFDSDALVAEVWDRLEAGASYELVDELIEAYWEALSGEPRLLVVDR